VYSHLKSKPTTRGVRAGDRCVICGRPATARSRRAGGEGALYCDDHLPLWHAQKVTAERQEKEAREARERRRFEKKRAARRDQFLARLRAEVKDAFGEYRTVNFRDLPLGPQLTVLTRLARAAERVQPPSMSIVDMVDFMGATAPLENALEEMKEHVETTILRTRWELEKTYGRL